jgi:hypothetical protein
MHNAHCQVFPRDDFVRLACAVEETSDATKRERREILGDILLNVDEEHSRGRKLFADFLVLLQEVTECHSDRYSMSNLLGQRFATTMLPPHLQQLAQVPLTFPTKPHGNRNIHLSQCQHINTIPVLALSDGVRTQPLKPSSMIPHAKRMKYVFRTCRSETKRRGSASCRTRPRSSSPSSATRAASSRCAPSSFSPAAVADVQVMK